MTVTEEIISMQERKKNPDKPAKFKKKKEKEGRQWHFFRIVNVPYIYFFSFFFSFSLFLRRTSKIPLNKFGAVKSMGKDSDLCRVA